MALQTLKRAELLYGKEGIQNLNNACVIVAGCGGVGGFAIEALARSGVGKLVLIDRDTVEETNVNRQICALHSTIDQTKTSVFKKRIADIRPETEVVEYPGWYDASLNDWLLEQKPDYILDCIDSISSKKDLIEFAIKNEIPIISSMGMARRMDPSSIRIMELEKTTNDPLAKQMRIWKRKNKIRSKIMTVASSELPAAMEKGEPLPSSIFVPATAGLLMASKAVSDLTQKEGHHH